MRQDDRSASVSSSPPPQFVPWMIPSPGLGSPFPWLKELNYEQRGLCLIHLLKACTNLVAAGNIENADIGFEHIAQLASPHGDTIQRISAYFSKALADRMLKSWPGLHKALYSTKVLSPERVLAQRAFFELCPFLKLSYLITNQAIIEAMEGEKVVHVIDLNSFEPAQWVNLIQTLSARPEGPPFLKITSIHERKEVLDQMALRLTEEADQLNIPLQFVPVVSKLENLDVDSLRVKTGEAVAISSVLQLHTLMAMDDKTFTRNLTAASKNINSSQLKRMLQISQNQHAFGEWLTKESTLVDCLSPDSALSTQSLPSSPKMGNFLSDLRSLSPKLIVITEQEANTNGLNLTERVDNALNYYAALFDCLESTVPRTSTQRLKVEKMLFGEEINNIISCEGIERKERLEKLEKWIMRLEFSGFGKVALSYHGMLQAGRWLLQNYGNEGYKIKEENGCVVICWQETPLFSISAWRPRRHE